MYYDPIHLLEQMNWPQSTQAIHPSNNNFNHLSSNQVSLPTDPTAKTIYTCIQLNGPIHKDQIAQQMHMDQGSLASYLLSLELNGHIHLQAGNTYCCS